MNRSAITTSTQPVGGLERWNPLASVMVWEIRRFLASRIFWLQALAFFLLLLLITWGQQVAEQFSFSPRDSPLTIFNVNGFIAGTSAWGLLDTLPNSLVLLVLLLPFITADGVTRDLQRRTHELVMTTVMPVWAYVWGRFLTGLLMSLGLAFLMLAAIFGMGLLLHMTVADYPPPSPDAFAVLWAGMVLPATVLVAGVGFALSTLFPKLSTQVKVAILVVWIVVAIFTPSNLRNTTPPDWYVNWDPTGAETARGLLSQYSIVDLFQTATNVAQFEAALPSLESKVPAIGSWFWSHLAMAGVSVALILIVSLVFKRSREVLA